MSGAGLLFISRVFNSSKVVSPQCGLSHSSKTSQLCTLGLTKLNVNRNNRDKYRMTIKNMAALLVDLFKFSALES